MVRRDGHGFTLIELLVVISIIAVIIGLVMASIGAVRRQTAKTRTSGTLAMVANALASAGASKSQNLGVVEHPLAASAATRCIFVRAADGSTVPTTGDAVKCQSAAWVPTGKIRVMPDDIFADPIAPQFFGVPRWRLTLLGATSKWVSSWYRVSAAGQTGTLTEPDLGTWVNQGFLRQAVTDATTDDWDNSADKAMSVAVGSAMDELENLGALKRPNTTRDVLIQANRLRQDKSNGALQPSAVWFPGTVLIGGLWTPYRVRGPSIVDSWGHEILISTTTSGGIRLESAGPDGVFRWDPGPDGILQTDPRATAPAGDDRDGSRDNLSLGPEE